MLNWPKKRNWGWYATLMRTPWFCVKLLRFKPGGELSLQRHKHRTEIWWFIKGWGVREPQTFEWCAFPFQIWKIKPNTWHTFMAFSGEPVYALELQYGKKVTEDDIERK